MVLISWLDPPTKFIVSIVARAVVTTNEKPQSIERDASEKYPKDKNK